MTDMTDENALSIRPHQIIFLEDRATRLYAEAIDVVLSRQLCWARPLMLVVGSTVAEPDETALAQLYLLDDGPDLLWPTALFQPALDLDVLSLLSQAQSLPKDGQQHQLGLQQLHAFIRQVWQAHLDFFAGQSPQPVSPPRSEKRFF